MLLENQIWSDLKSDNLSDLSKHELTELNKTDNYLTEYFTIYMYTNV